jgi:hypothetical protein
MPFILEADVAPVAIHIPCAVGTHRESWYHGCQRSSLTMRQYKYTYPSSKDPTYTQIGSQRWAL